MNVKKWSGVMSDGVNVTPVNIAFDVDSNGKYDIKRCEAEKAWARGLHKTNIGEVIFNNSIHERARRNFRLHKPAGQLLEAIELEKSLICKNEG